MNIRNVAVFAITIGFTLPAYALVTTTDAYVKTSAPQQTTATSYPNIKSDAEAKLIRVSLPIAKTTKFTK